MISPLAAWYLTTCHRRHCDDDDAYGSWMDLTRKDWLWVLGYGLVFFLLFAVLPWVLVLR